SASARFCSRCGRYVEPVGKGACPICFAFLPKNSAARRHPINVARRDALLADLVAQFPPANIIERANCEQLATTLAQLETIRPGSTDWQRLVTAAQTLGAALQLPPATHPTT